MSDVKILVNSREVLDRLLGDDPEVYLKIKKHLMVELSKDKYMNEAAEKAIAPFVQKLRDDVFNAYVKKLGRESDSTCYNYYDLIDICAKSFAKRITDDSHFKFEVIKRVEELILEYISNYINEHLDHYKRDIIRELRKTLISDITSSMKDEIQKMSKMMETFKTEEEGK